MPHKKIKAQPPLKKEEINKARKEGLIIKIGDKYLERYFQQKKLELEKKKKEERRILFENERISLCYETGISIKIMKKIERFYQRSGLEGLVFMIVNYKIKRKYEERICEFLFKNKEFISEN